jgi:hypothetical protein
LALGEGHESSILRPRGSRGEEPGPDLYWLRTFFFWWWGDVPCLVAAGVRSQGLQLLEGGPVPGEPPQPPLCVFPVFPGQP